MLFNFAPFSSLLLVPAVLGVPSALGASVAASDTTDSSWVGASLSTDNGTLYFVTATFTTPTMSGSTGASFFPWIGLDAFGCESGVFLVAGVLITITSDGRPEYQASVASGDSTGIQYLSGISISAGDVIKLTVEASSVTSGEAGIENLSNGNMVSLDFHYTVPLCLASAQWGAGDLTLDLPLADFGTVDFSGAVAGGILGQTYTPSGPDVALYNIEQNNQVLTSTSVNEFSVTIKYSGN